MPSTASCWVVAEAGRDVLRAAAGYFCLVALVLYAVCPYNAERLQVLGCAFA